MGDPSSRPLPSTSSSGVHGAGAFITRVPLAVQLGLALAARLFLFFGTTLPTILVDRPELATPITSFRRLSEGVFLLRRGLDPYDGGAFNHSPLHLLVFSTIMPIGSRLLVPLVWTAADILSGWILADIWRTRQRRAVAKNGLGVDDRQNWESLVVFLYLWNPYTLLTCLARSMTSLDNALVLLAIHSAVLGRSALSLACLSLATVSSFFPCLLAPLLILMLLPLRKKTSTSSRVFGAKAVTALVLFLGGLLFGGRMALGSWGKAVRTWQIILDIQDLTPNVGLSWYFFTEMFDHFRSFFVVVFQMHILAYVVPLAISFSHDPLFAVTCMLSIIALLKTYPTLGDASLALSLVPLFPEIIPHLRTPLLSIALSLYSLILLPLLNYLWLGAGSANANFFYAAGLVYGLGNAMAAVDLVWAGRKVKVLEEYRQEQEKNGKETLAEGKGTRGKLEVVQLAF